MTENNGQNNKLLTVLSPAFLNPTIREAIHTTLDSGKPIGIACSGGADSVFLLRWALTKYAANQTQFIVVHFNHKTRGTESDADALFVETLSKNLGIQSCIGTFDSQKSCPPKDEAGLRRERMKFFERVQTKYDINLILTAHHLNDRVESLLMRLSRASALDGLIAPKPTQQFKKSGLSFARPLLNIRKQQMIESLTAIKQIWREDASNQNDDYYRNFVRNRLIPYWAEHTPAALIPNLHQSLEHLENDANTLQEIAEKVIKSIHLEANSFPLKRIRSTQPDGIVTRVLWKWLNKHFKTASITHNQITRILSLETNESLAISETHILRMLDNGELQMQSIQPPASFEGILFELVEGSILYFPDGNLLKSEQIPLTPVLYKSITHPIKDPAIQVQLDLKASDSTQGIRVVFWSHGMRYQPFGRTSSKKLKTCFIDRKVSSNQRKRLPVVINPEGEILWVPGLQPSEIGRVTKRSKAVLRLTYQSS